MRPARQFLYRLALASGYWVHNPDAMARRMPYRVLMEWYAYAALEPFGEERADLRAAMVAVTVANCMGRKKGQKAFKLTDFMLEFGQATKKKKRRMPTPRELMMKAYWINIMMGGSVVDKRRPAR